MAIAQPTTAISSSQRKNLRRHWLQSHSCRIILGLSTAQTNLSRIKSDIACGWSMLRRQNCAALKSLWNGCAISRNFERKAPSRYAPMCRDACAVPRNPPARLQLPPCSPRFVGATCIRPHWLYGQASHCQRCRSYHPLRLSLSFRRIDLVGTHGLDAGRVRQA